MNWSICKRSSPVPPLLITDHVFCPSFREKILYCVPVIDETDLQDAISVTRERRPLAYCAGFVASQFIPGCATVREQLLWHVQDFLRTTGAALEKDESIVWTQLQAYAILYAYRSAADVFNIPQVPESPQSLNHWALKSSIEAFALRLGLHRSRDDLNASIRLGQDLADVSGSSIFQRYVYWLWLFTMSHHFSLMTRTPPSIREDSTISMACDLLRDIPQPSRVTRILAEVDLCMLWHQAGHHAPGLAEWWCTPADYPNLEDLARVLEDADAALEVWGRRWGLRGESNATIPSVDVSNNRAVDFHFRITRFCISTFGTRCILQQSSLAADSGSSSEPRTAQMTREFVLKSVEAAHTCCRSLQDIPPSRRENARYVADFGFAVIAFCCLYIIQAYELYGSTAPILQSYLPSVEEVAIFMTEMAVGNNRAPSWYGTWVLQRLRKTVVTAHQSDLGESGHPHKDTSPWLLGRRGFISDGLPAGMEEPEIVPLPLSIDASMGVGEGSVMSNDPFGLSNERLLSIFDHNRGSVEG